MLSFCRTSAIIAIATVSVAMAIISKAQGYDPKRASLSVFMGHSSESVSMAVNNMSNLCRQTDSPCLRQIHGDAHKDSSGQDETSV